MKRRASKWAGRCAGTVGVALCLALGLTLGGCAVPIADLPAIGLPAGAPARPADPGVYPAIHDVPTGRSGAVLDPTEQAKIEDDLKAARNRQAGVTGQSSKTVDKASD